MLADGAAAALMAAGQVDLVITGADRIAADGSVANKVGTYGLAVLARHHGVPFVVAAPVSTVDLATPDGAAIPVEQRAARRGHRDGRPAGRAGRDGGLESGLRRDPAVPDHRHRHRTGGPAAGHCG